MNIENIKNIENSEASAAIELKRGKSSFKKIISKCLNFICALIISFVVFLAIGAFLSADLHSKDMLGDYDSQIFSFSKSPDNMAEIIAFGEKFTVDFNKIYEARATLNSLAEINKEYTPSIFVLCGEIINDCAASIAGSLKKIPSIIEYLYNQANQPSEE